MVHDIDASCAYYESIGIGPWQMVPPFTDLTELQMPSAEAFLKMQYRYVALDNVVLQLCQPPEDDCPQRRFLDEKGEGVFHIGFEAMIDRDVAEAEQVGLEVFMKGRRENGTGFAYFDTLDRAGVVLMIRQSTPSV